MTAIVLSYEHLFNPSSARGKFYTVAIVEDGGDFFVLTNFGPGQNHMDGLTSGQLHANHFPTKGGAANWASRKVASKIKGGYRHGSGVPGVRISQRMRNVMASARPGGGVATRSVTLEDRKPVIAFRPGERATVEEYVQKVTMLIHAPVDELLRLKEDLKAKRDGFANEAAQVEAAYELFEEALKHKLG